jgi:DnaJ-class molecular chaperone
MTPTHYEILALHPSLRNASYIPTQSLRTAYRRALLQYHPDKLSSSALNTKGARGREKYTIDEITQAFNVLGDKKARAKYDAELKLQRPNSGINGHNGHNGAGFQTGVEAVDLDDLNFEENGGEGGEGIWSRSCRCGQERGFEVREGDLEDAEREGEREVSVGCKGCSLWLRVLFGVVEEEADHNG